MSYILEALRKSETQRRHHTAPTLRVVQEVASETATTSESRRQPMWPWMVGAALLVNGGITLYHHLNNHNAPAISAAPTAPTTNNAMATTTAAASNASAAHVHNLRSATPEDIPLLQNLPLEFRRRLPALSVDVLVYSEAPSERFVLVNMRKYHEGEAIDGNLFVEGITQRSVVLSFDTVRFQVLARR